MLRALIYLRLVSFRNWTISRLRRLRQPRYLGGAVVGLAYLYFVFYGLGSGPPEENRPGMPGGDGVPGMGLMIDGTNFAGAIGALVLLTIATLMWLVPTRRAALGFSEAEIAFLFPAPVTRRALVHFRLLSSQLRSLIGATVMMLFSNRWTFVGGNALTHAVGWWFVFSALNLHFTGASFTLTRLSDRGVGTWRRRTAVLLLAAAVLGVAYARGPAAPDLAAAEDDLILQDLANWITAIAGTAPLSWVLWPVQALLAPFLAADSRAFLLALSPALLVITVHYLWVVQTAVAFEDASIEQAGERAARLAAWRAGDRRIGRSQERGRRAPFRLHSPGRPELAFLWKNLLSTWPWFTPRVLFISAAVITGIALWLDAQPYWQPLLAAAGAFALVFGGYTLVVGPQFARQDLRIDLPNADILKTYPLTGWQVVLGELLAPTAILSGVLWLALLVVALAFDPTRVGVGWLTPPLRVAAAIALAAIVPALAALQLLVPNAATLLFPGWFHASRGRGGGVEVVGQRMIFFLAQVLAMIAALLPPMLCAGFLLFIGQWLIGPVAAIILTAVVTLAVLLGELWLGLWWLGGRFEKLDLASELRP